LIIVVIGYHLPGKGRAHKRCQPFFEIAWLDGHTYWEELTAALVQLWVPGPCVLSLYEMPMSSILTRFCDDGQLLVVPQSTLRSAHVEYATRERSHEKNQHVVIAPYLGFLYNDRSGVPNPPYIRTIISSLSFCGTLVPHSPTPPRILLSWASGASQEVGKEDH